MDKHERLGKDYDEAMDDMVEAFRDQDEPAVEPVVLPEPAEQAQS